MKMEQGRLRRGFSISSPMDEANSSPAKANAIDASRFNAGKLFRSALQRCQGEFVRRRTGDGAVKAEQDNYQPGDVGADAAGVLQPFARPDADDVYQGGEPQDGERDRQRVGAIVTESALTFPEDKSANDGG